MKTIHNTLLTAIILVMCFGANAQTPIVQVNTSFVDAATSTNYTASGANNSTVSNKTYTYSYGTATKAAGHTRQLNSFTIGGDEYNYIHNANSYVKIRRVNNAVVKTDRQLIWVEKAVNAADNAVAVVNPYNDNMEAVFSGNALNWGTDNLFANQGDGNGNNNNIERLDVIFAGGIISEQNNKVGFALFERGNDNEHDPFVIAAITEVDVNGNPTAYGNPLRVGIANWGNLPASTIDYYVVRRDPNTENSLRMSTWGTQNIGGVFISFSDLGVNTGEKIYGYSIFAYDLPANATSANLVDYTNTTYFPTNTSGGTMQGGIDLIALTGLLSIPEVVILPPTAYNIAMPSMLNTAKLTQMLPLEATAATGDIANYTIETLPAAEMGQVFLCTTQGCTPLTIGQVLAPEEINHLFFLPNPNYTGDVVFYYHATDTHNQISNTASYTIPLIAPGFGPLPVKLLSFSGSINNKSVVLNWQTTQETNSSYYEVQRSADGSNFEPVATITAKGNSNSTVGYTAADDLFFYQHSKVFYRLKMVDTDGSFKYSAIIQLRPNAETKTTTVKAWPNPYTSQLNTEYYSSNNGSITISLLDMNGRAVAATSVTVSKGRNSFAITQAQSLPRGTYILQINNGSTTENIRIIKQ
ncbi:MAG TPA: T9SS type A sorting domain-containing protein [Ferruginibacter sp.]|nr:T9SS type A sorting domain-containing protein [Ferruginibacter sp.]HMP19504.1 T9SS type A sorting domain-containing protein [Ferruginibacter sp.]